MLKTNRLVAIALNEEGKKCFICSNRATTQTEEVSISGEDDGEAETE